MCTGTCLFRVGTWISLSVPLFIDKPSLDAGRRNELPGDVRIDRARKYNETFVELCTNECLGLCFRSEGPCFPRAPLLRQRAAFTNLEGDIPSRRHRTHQLIALAQSVSCFGAGITKLVDLNQGRGDGRQETRIMFDGVNAQPSSPLMYVNVAHLSAHTLS